MAQKKTRHQKILEIVERQRIGTQSELLRALEDAGFEVTQSTVSRDIQELGLTKKQDPDGFIRYTVYDEEDNTKEKFIRVMRDAVVSMDTAGNLLVIRTISGMAMAVAAAIDAMKFRDVVGCIAGDDTIFAAVRTAEETELLTQRIRTLIGTGRQ